MLPREYPPWQTIYYHFWKWRRDGRLRRAHDRLREAVREAEGRDRNPSGAVIDSQAVKGTGMGGPERGPKKSGLFASYDNTRPEPGTAVWFVHPGHAVERDSREQIAFEPDAI